MAETSNQAVITNVLLKPESKPLLEELVDKYGSEGAESVYDRAVRLAQHTSHSIDLERTLRRILSTHHDT